MPRPLARRDFNKIVEVLLKNIDARKATIYVHDDCTIGGVRQKKHNQNDGRHELVISYGKPTRSERRDMNAVKDNGEDYGRWVRIDFWPPKKQK